MIRRVTTAAVASIVAMGVASVAIAASSHSAKVYRASLDAVDPPATTAGVADVEGSSQLVDGKKNNKASLHMHNLVPDTTYLWHVHSGSCADTGPPVPGWHYRTHDDGNGTVTTNAAGNGNTKAKSTTFDAKPGTDYSVNVHVSTPTNGLPAGTIIACGDLKRSKASGKSKSTSKGKSESHTQKAHPPQANGPKP